MPRLTSPAGAVVNVPDDKVQWLLKQGYEPVREPAKVPAKKAIVRKATSSKSEQ